ncbi:MAG: hypothetical protein ABSA39_06060 [Edaphobacter sp.]
MILGMALPPEVLNEVDQLRRKPGEWFSIDEITQRNPELLAAQFIKRDTGEKVSFPHESRDVYRKLDQWAARLLEREIRSLEASIADVLTHNSIVPGASDDAIILSGLTQYIQTTAEELKSEMTRFTGYKEEPWERTWSKVDETGKRMASEVSVTIRLASEISRLEVVGSGHEPLDRVGIFQTRIERFCASFVDIPHPFDETKRLRLDSEALNKAVRLLVFVIFHPVEEPRLSGYESKFVGTFSRYLTCARDTSSSAVEQVATLFEPFLKKFAFLFKVKDSQGELLWKASLDGLIAGLALTSSNLKKTEAPYWITQPLEGAVLRRAYQGRHKAAHEAHDYPYYERERNAYFLFAALLVSCDILIKARTDVAETVAHQGEVELVRDLFVKIEELVDGSYGPRLESGRSPVPSRLEKLLGYSRRAQAIWPVCSAALSQGLDSEYYTVKSELTEGDREGDIESYLEDMRGGSY